MAMRRGRGGFGPRGGRRALIEDFLAENPDCAERMARFGVERLRERGVPESEIRAHLEDLQDCGHLPDVDLDSVLA